MAAATPTVMFADLTGSTAVFEKLGNEAATRTVTALTDWIMEVAIAHGGRVVKTLGDGVLAVFPDGADAIEAVVQLQREHARRSTRHGPAARLQLQVGLACGEIVEVGGDCFGDAVNVAARLSDLSGGRQILATDSVVEQLPSAPPGTRFHPLGSMPIRGRERPVRLFRIDWQEDSSTDMMTIPALETPRALRPRAAPGAIELHSQGQMRIFTSEQMPVHLGRSSEAELLIIDPRVSRLHARIDWHNQGFVLVDLSSNGTCVRFQGAPSELTLRRNECVLHDNGEIALGPDFSDWSLPTVRFALRPR
ncbi:MAG TPA: adenylate/guanylate cyclase domain-containing protein [Ramlibacter sp.]|uniref:adenylate/guanylate cyclase domain-containing protein n=1 Tax=Ramlibacter sp. TaxID=1917967 RepID=UPI002D7FC7D8|nr:adenylate/guanylate cyclase domain-containing protein [Ramlibacter sp.]HET8744401.1 adenylate/guanylate cyclase domain-containing protein [Ramlibacter sp.]